MKINSALGCYAVVFLAACIAITVVLSDVVAQSTRNTPQHLGHILPDGFVQDDVTGFSINTEAETEVLPASKILSVYQYQNFETPQLVAQQCFLEGSNKPGSRAHALLAEKAGNGVVTEYPVTVADAEAFGVSLGTLKLAIARCRWL